MFQNGSKERLQQRKASATMACVILFTIPSHPILPLGQVMFQSDVDHSPSQDMLNQVTPPKLLGTHLIPESDRICACLEELPSPLNYEPPSPPAWAHVLALPSQIPHSHPISSSLKRLRWWITFTPYPPISSLEYLLQSKLSFGRPEGGAHWMSGKCPEHCNRGHPKSDT